VEYFLTLTEKPEIAANPQVMEKVLALMKEL
jgi:hypothetical protein